MHPLKQGSLQFPFVAISSSFETGGMERKNVATVCGVSVIVGTMLSVGEGTSVEIGALLFGSGLNSLLQPVTRLGSRNKMEIRVKTLLFNDASQLT
jgi:hypothetical protein